MIIGHEIRNENNEQVLYFYFDFNYEIGSLTKDEQELTFLQKILKYIKEKKIVYNGLKVVLVVNGIIIGSLLFNPDKGNAEYVLSSNIPKQVVVENTKEETKNDVDLTPVKKETVVIKPTTKTPSKTTTSKTTTTTKTTKPASPPTTSNEPTSAPTTIPEEPIKEVKYINPITVYQSNGTVVTMELEDYLVGVVAAEMPASFSLEALKAQAVAARTYALKAISQGRKLTDSVSTQVYYNNTELKNKWGSSYSTYYNKIKSAVNATEGAYITYNGKYIDAVYHSTNNGYTEDSIIVWGNNIPYLKTVDSHWDLNASTYLKTVTKDIVTISNLLGLNLSESSVIDFDKDDSNHIVSATIDDKTFSGINLRNILGLRSTDFDMTISGTKITFTTRGYGHAVGLSQYGANGMAKEGYTYIQILKHYYTGVSIIL